VNTAENQNQTRPATEAAYIKWAKDNLSVDFDDQAAGFYRMQVSTALLTIGQHPFFNGLESFLHHCDEEYHHTTSSVLFMSNMSVNLNTKPFGSAVNKTFRMNIVWNKNFPEKPRHHGWVTPQNWLGKINDIVRGRIVCKYIDAPKFLAEKLNTYAQGMNLQSRYRSEERDEGYYAFHFHVKIPTPINLWDSTRLVESMIDMAVEIQITTQLQEVLYQITHQFYAGRKSEVFHDRSAWKWEISSNRFKAGYMSHTLHLLEAIILQLRDEAAPPEIIDLESTNG